MSRPLVVIGDVMLDVDRSGTVERLSPEAPVPVLRDPVDTRRPGGAALAALLAARNTFRPVVLIAPWADDDAAGQLAELLGQQVQVIGIGWTGSTPVKTRLRAGSHPIARVDEGGRPGALAALPTAARTALTDAAAVLVADYGVGATGFPAIREALQGLSGRTPVVWDPHPRGSSPVPGTCCVTPNEPELLALSAGSGAGSPPPGTPGAPSPFGVLAAAANDLAARWGATSVAVTLGSRGALLCTPGGPPLMVTARALVAGDTCGAGDSFAAAAAVALADGALPSEAVEAAVQAAGRFVEQGGAAGVDAAGAPADRPVAPGAPPPVDRLLARIRRSGGTVVATGGCFDLLHAGHIATLEAARAMGDCLVVVLNSDSSVRRLKGDGRPLQPQQDRARVLGALQCVDAVVIFNEDTPARVLEELQPDVWAKGGDYSGVELPEAAVLSRWGGQVVTVPYLAGRSTTALVELAVAPAR